MAICGDIGESHDLAKYLVEMNETIQKPIYFVLGNHDFYRGSIATTRLEVAEIAEQSRYLTYLTAMRVLELTPDTAIIGHDGWPDGRLGDYDRTDVILNDHLLIAELSKWFEDFELDKPGLSKTMVALADEAAQHFRDVLNEAVSRYSNIIAITHVPPFREAALYQGKISGDDFPPYFACKVVGDVFREVMQANPQSNLLVLCGHTHGGCDLQVLDNLRVLTGEAQYKKPVIQQVLEYG